MTTHDPGTPRLLAERTADGRYIARNERGAEVIVGAPGGEGSFSPGELLKIAVATCSALSADHILASRLGKDFPASVSISSTSVPDENRYAEIASILNVDLSTLPEERREALIARAMKAIDRICTVGRTLEHGAHTRFDFDT